MIGPAIASTGLCELVSQNSQSHLGIEPLVGSQPLELLVYQGSWFKVISILLWYKISLWGINRAESDYLVAQKGSVQKKLQFLSNHESPDGNCNANEGC